MTEKPILIAGKWMQMLLNQYNQYNQITKNGEKQSKTRLSLIIRRHKTTSTKQR